ncbi:MAG: hypothetical protein EXR07_05890 [Acetobacteraceae bacterium]|nr:hypothetical protein [Acetobacteraceae bacterium]
MSPKALLVLAGEAFRRVHDLDELAARIPMLYPRFTPQAEAIRSLTIWGVAYRYPGLEDDPEPLPAIEELARITDLLTDCATRVRELIGTGSRQDGMPSSRAAVPPRIAIR